MQTPLKSKDDKASRRTWYRFTREVAMLRRVQGCAHASGRVPKLCGAHILRTTADASAVAGFHLTLVTEYLPYSLTEMRQDAPLDEQTVRPFIADVLEALVHLHLRGVAHQDVKVANLRLKTRTGSVCLVDFGLAEHFDGPAPAELRGTPGYLAPELFTEAVVDRRLADIYSTGIVLYNLVSPRPAFYSRSKSKVLELNRQNQLDWARVEDKLSPAALRCLQAMLCPELTDTACSLARPSAEACLLEQEWFTVFLGPSTSPSGAIIDPEVSSTADESVSRRTFCSSSTCIPDGVHSSESFVGLAGKQE
jgi:serine/threonine protein kinase